MESLTAEQIGFLVGAAVFGAGISVLALASWTIETIDAYLKRKP